MTVSVLPAATADTAALARKSAGPPVSATPPVSETLLLIDPDHYTAGLLAETLQEMGYAGLRIVHNALDASAALGTGRYGAVLLNFQSNQRDMLACCATARLSDPHLPVIVIAAPGPGLAEEIGRAHV